MIEHFDELTQFLQENSRYWRTNPFLHSVGWKEDNPNIVDALSRLQDEDIDRLQRDEQQLSEFLSSQFRPARWTQQFLQWEELQPVSELSGSLSPNAKRSLRHVAGRKADQIRYLVDSLGPMQGEVLEWCAGKANLGRYLSTQHSVSVNSLEIDEKLVADGNRLAQSAGVDLRLHTCDVLTSSAEHFFSGERHVLALHACGKLHETMMTRGVAAKSHRLSVVPCCYHLIDDDKYQPMSATARGLNIDVSRQELRLAVRQSITAPPRELVKRKQKQIWRLAFDSLVRETSGEDIYISTPSISDGLLQGAFEDYCVYTAKLKNLTIPTRPCWDDYLKQGQDRFYWVQRFELIQMIFRRPLEVWLMLDRYFYLQEEGYECDLRAFCPPEITPRNLLLDAVR